MKDRHDVFEEEADKNAFKEETGLDAEKFPFLFSIFRKERSQKRNKFLRSKMFYDYEL